jgi:hypothetical protein
VHWIRNNEQELIFISLPKILKGIKRTEFWCVVVLSLNILNHNFASTPKDASLLTDIKMFFSSFVFVTKSTRDVCVLGQNICQFQCVLGQIICEFQYVLGQIICQFQEFFFDRGFKHLFSALIWVTDFSSIFSQNVLSNPLNFGLSFALFPFLPLFDLIWY